MPVRFLLSILLTLPCVAATFPDYPVKAANEYANITGRSGIAIAVVPVEEPADQRRYFGLDLRSRGYIPVFVFIANQTSGSSFLLDSDGITCNSAGNSRPASKDPAGSAKVLAIASAVPSLYTFMASVTMSKFKDLRENFLRKGLRTSTVSPGTSVHGFVFIPVRQRYKQRQKMQITVPFQVSVSGERIGVDCEF